MACAQLYFYLGMENEPGIVLLVDMENVALNYQKVSLIV